MKQFFEGRIISDLCKVFGSVLLAAGLCCSISAQEDFFLATHNGNAELVKKMISRGANVNMKTAIGFTPLMVAAGDGHANIVKMLIAAKADIDAVTKDGFTAIYFAAVRKHPNAVKVLLDAGASIFLKTKDGESTVLDYKIDDESRDLIIEKFFGDNICFAAYWGSIKQVKKLLAQGKNVNMKQGEGGLTPLIFAITKEHTEIVKLLIAAKADVNLQNSAGETPLMVAVGGNDPQIVKILLDAGADINLKDKKGRTVLNYKMAPQTRAMIMRKVKSAR